MYADFDIIDEAVKIARSDVEIAQVQSILGNKELARLVLNDEIQSTFDLEDLSYFISDFGTDARLKRETVQVLAAADAFFLKPADGLWFTEVCFIFRQENETLATDICAAVSNYYNNQKKNDLALAADVLSSIGWHLISENQTAAKEWLDLLIERNHTFVKLKNQPLHASLKDSAGYLPCLDQMKEIAHAHREQIQHDNDRL